MRSTSIRTIDQRELTRASNIQLMAFSSDPIMRWMWPEPDAYVRSFPGLVRGFGGGAFEKGTAHVTEDFHGGALWLPPGVGPDDEALDRAPAGGHRGPRDGPEVEAVGNG